MSSAQSGVAPLGENAVPQPSPALDLQVGLIETFAAAAERRWPVAATLGLVGTSCAAFWAIAALGVAHMLG